MGEALSEEQIQDVLRGISIPPQPQIMADLQMEQASPNPDLKEIIRLISKDVGIAGSVLKTVNSPFYGLRNRITSIEQAIMLIGMNTVVNIVNTVAIRNALGANGALSEEETGLLNRFWDSAHDVALVCALLSRQLRVENPDEAYALGLFHNAAIPLLLLRDRSYLHVLIQAYADEQQSITAVENQQLNTNHAVLSYYVARAWKMPEVICDAISLHHNLASVFHPHHPASGQIQNYVALLKLAEHLCGLHGVLGRHDVDREWQQFGPMLRDYLSLNEDDVDDILTTCRDLGLAEGRTSL